MNLPVEFYERYVLRIAKTVKIQMIGDVFRLPKATYDALRFKEAERADQAQYWLDFELCLKLWRTGRINSSHSNIAREVLDAI